MIFHCFIWLGGIPYNTDSKHQLTEMNRVIKIAEVIVDYLACFCLSFRY